MTSQVVVAESNREIGPVEDGKMSRWRRMALVALAVGGLAGLVGLFVDRAEFWRAYLLAWLFCVEIGLGGLGLALLQAAGPAAKRAGG